MIDTRLRRGKELLLAPLVRRMPPLSPMVFTAASFACGAATALFAFAGAGGAAVTSWVLSRLFDGLDGELARYRNRQSDLGAYLDLIGDMILYAAVVIAITAASESAPWAAATVLMASFYVNAAGWMFLSAVLVKREVNRKARREHSERYNTSLPMPSGLIEGGESVVFVLIALLLDAQLAALYIVFASLTAITALQRIAWAYRNLQKGPRSPATPATEAQREVS